MSDQQQQGVTEQPAPRAGSVDATEQAKQSNEAPRTDEQKADGRLGGDAAHSVLGSPQNIKEMRAADAGRQMFSPQLTYRDDIPDSLLDDHPDLAGVPPEARKAALAEVREMAADLELSVAEVRDIREVRAILKDRPPSDEQRAAWREQALADLKKEFGDDYKAALRDARTLVKRDPRLVQILDGSDFGNHPKVVRMIVQSAHRARMAGRLK